MKRKALRVEAARTLARSIVAITCGSLLLAGTPLVQAWHVSQQPATTQQTVKIPSDQLDALVAPIALYPDNLLSQTLVASTYPLEIIQLQQWLDKRSEEHTSELQSHHDLVCR